ncbi:hypothetical protein SLS53_003640 [Cytospora paraplurivora]|uniref:Uncharacterized protein n=1 Tax=Cytospora paraplurivora TaxID=2898453 RepID=A0AAN9UH45_9PEZI
MDEVEEKAPLFEEHVHDQDFDRGNAIVGKSPWPKHLSFRRCLLYGVIIQVLLLILYTVVSLAIIHRATHTDSDPDVHAFAGLAVRYKFRLYDNFVDTPYAGEPTAEGDEAWHTLLNNMSVRVTAEELAAHNQTSVALPNGGYLAWLGVFHELHCVKMLRQWSWREHYFPNADTSALAVFKWDGNAPHPMLNTKRVPHRCVDWDAMMSSHVDRLVAQEEITSLRNPNLEDTGESKEAKDKLPGVSAKGQEDDE